MKISNIFFKQLLLLVSILWSVNLISCESSQQCAVFYSADAPNKEGLVLDENSKLGNLEDYGANQNGSWRITENCKLTACTGPYFTGSCEDFTGLENSTSESVAERRQSASCKCNKECSCSQVGIQSNVCAHVYFTSEGCTSCHSSYAEILPGSKQNFLNAWVENIRSFLTPPGCQIRVYSEEDFDGDMTEIPEGFYGNWSGVIRSYECECGQEQQTPMNGTPARTSSAVVKISIPSSMDDIVEKLQKESNPHPGLLAGFSSLKNGKSSQNAYIMVIGSTGAGKSSVINNLLKHSNITLAGDDFSTTSEILEFRIPLNVDELGLTNSELRIIDTPGMGDTRGIHQDAKFLATLDEYLRGHEELKSRIPNVILILHPFNDNRFDGVGSNFVKMVQSLSSFRGRITDENYSNVVFVFSHLCSESKQLQHNPFPKLALFKEVIEKFSLFPKPILISVIENQARENDLLMVDENFELPNGEYFPKNLVNKIDLITRKTGDKLGNAIFKAAFGNELVQFNVSSKIRELVSDHHPKLAKYLSLLSTITSTPVSIKLEEAYLGMETTVKAQFPHVLQYLQTSLKVRDIHSLEDIPRTTGSILKLLKDLEYSPAVAYLLDKGLNLTLPYFPQNTIAGYSYNIFEDVVLPVSPFKMSQVQPSSIGFLLSTSLQNRKFSPIVKTNILEVLDTRQDYINSRLHTFGVNISSSSDTSGFTSIGNKIKPGFYVKDISCANNFCSFTASRTYKGFKLELDFNRAQLSREFENRVSNLERFNESSYENVEAWKNLFLEYGTHIVKSAFGGGRIDMRVTSPPTISNEDALSVFNSVEFAENLTMLVYGDKIDPKRIFPNGTSHSLVFIGGDQAYHTNDLTNVLLEKASKLMKMWEKSLNYYPAVFPEEFIPISEITSSLGNGISEKIREATDRLLTSTLKFIPPPPPTPDPKIIEAELARVREEHEQQLRLLAEEKKKLEENAERERQAQLEARGKHEEQQRQLEEKRRKEEVERLRRLEEERQRMLRQQEEERRRAQAEAHVRHLEHLRQLQKIQEQKALEMERLKHQMFIRCTLSRMARIHNMAC